jgi:hypothetical protein
MSPFPCNSTVWVQNRSLVSRVIMLDADGHPHVLAIVHTYMVLLCLLHVLATILIAIWPGISCQPVAEFHTHEALDMA